MRLLLLLLILTPIPSLAQSSLDWIYLPVDSNKQKWGDWAEPEWLRYFGLDAGDVNRDGWLDIVSGRYVYHNPGGDMSQAWTRTVLDDNVDAIFCIDIDDDPFADIIAQALPNLYWYEAFDEAGTRYKRSRIATIPATSHVNSQGFEKADLIPGDKPELLIAGNGNVYAISIPDDPNQSWPTHLIAPNTSDEGIGVGDIDGDGDLDIACGRRPEEEDEPTILVWFENPGSIDQAWKDHPIGRTEHPIDRIEIGDLDADQQVEIIITEERYPGLEADASIYAFSAGANLYQDWQRQRIALQYSTNNLDLGDIDQDGDLDLLTAEHKGQALELQLWRNDGQGNFQKEILDTGKENHLGTQWVDLDADGDLDIIGAAWDNYRWMHLWRNPQYEPSDQQMANIRTERSAKPGTQIRQTNYEGSPHYVIHTESLTYYYDQTGGGFSRIIDRQGNDWISFKREPWGEYPASAAAAFRGLPNLVYQGEDDGAGHPGHQKCKSWLEGDQIVTQSLSGDWKWTWEFGEDYARLRILQTDQDRPYWFLYEGTPGGKFAPAQTYFGHNEGGPYHRQHDYYSGAILAGQFQWMYAGHQSQQRVFYMLQIQSDSKVDMLSMLGNQVEDGLASLDGMSVWGFGRSADTKALLYGPQEFVIGMYEHKIDTEAQQQELQDFIQQRYLLSDR